MQTRTTPWGITAILYERQVKLYDWLLRHANTFHSLYTVAQELHVHPFTLGSVLSGIRIRFGEDNLPRHFVSNERGYALLLDGNDPRNNIRERWGIDALLTPRRIEVLETMEELFNSTHAPIAISALAAQLNVGVPSVQKHLAFLCKAYGDTHIVVTKTDFFLND